MRDECLNAHWFLSVAHARRQIEAWRVNCDAARPHSSLGHRTPDEFVREHERIQLVQPDPTRLSA